MREIILISFLGPDQPKSVHSINAGYCPLIHYKFLDVGQAVIHNQLTLGIVVSSDRPNRNGFGHEGNSNFST